MIGVGTFLNPILKIITVVAILGAVYLFVIKPTLDTTEAISNRAFDTSDRIQQQIREDVQGAFPAATEIDFKIPKSAEQAQKLGDCVSGAAGDVARIQRCMDRFGS